jgi:predicted phage tail protein
MTNVYLYGALGRRFGFRWSLEVSSPAEAVRAIMANRPDFQRYLYQHSAPGYQVCIGNDPVPGPDGLQYPIGRQAIKIVPVVRGGAKSPVIGIIIGVVIIAAAVVTLNPELIGLAPGFFVTAGGVGASLAVTAGFIGAGLVVSGLTSLLTKPTGVKIDERPENTPSTIFGGPVNTTAGGHPVPVGYGRLRVGSAVISAGISTKDVAIT